MKQTTFAQTLTQWRQQVYSQTNFGRPSKRRRTMSATKSTMQSLTYMSGAFHRRETQLTMQIVFLTRSRVAF
jgi:hypothetical protein